MVFDSTILGSLSNSRADKRSANREMMLEIMFEFLV